MGQAEEARRGQLEATAHAHLGAIQRLNEVAASAPDPAPTYEAGLAVLADLLGADQAALALFDSDGVIRVVATRNLSENYRSVAEGRSPWEPDAAGARPFFVADILSAPAGSLRHVIAGPATRALAILPLISGGHVLGTFTAWFDRPRTFDCDELGLGPIIAAQVSFAIDKGRLEAELRLANLVLTATLDAAPDGITVQAPDGSLLFANGEAAAMVGFATPADLLAAHPAAIMAGFEVLDEHGNPLALADFPGRQALQGIQPPDRLVRWRTLGPAGQSTPAGESTQAGEGVRATPAGERWSLLSARPVRAEDGNVRFAVNVFRDVTERQQAAEALRRSERRLSFLAATSPRLLDSALDYRTVLDRVAELFVPDMADVCSVREIDADGSARRAASLYSDAVDAAVVERLEGLDATAQRPALETLPSTESLLAPDIAASAMAHAFDGLGLQSLMVVALQARGVRTGDITLMTVSGGRRYDEADLALAEEVARRAGLTIENARLFHERSTIASTLQRALLPPVLPDIPGIELAARYHAASSEIGGDFYDVVEVGPSRWMIAVGDVCGKGLESASLTAMVRYTLRAFSRIAGRPSDLLRRLNDALLPQLDPEKFCTVACAILDTSGDHPRLTVALGGHLPPLHVTPGGAVRAIGTPGTLLGTLPDPELADHEVVLHAGDALVVFTDGCVGELPSGADDDRLVRVLRQEAGAPAAYLAQAVEMVAHAEVGHTDDLTVLVLRRPAPPRA